MSITKLSPPAQKNQLPMHQKPPILVLSGQAFYPHNSLPNITLLNRRWCSLVEETNAPVTYSPCWVSRHTDLRNGRKFPLRKFPCLNKLPRFSKFTNQIIFLWSKMRERRENLEISQCLKSFYMQRRSRNKDPCPYCFYLP